jgi:hypothetical protein
VDEMKSEDSEKPLDDLPWRRDKSFMRSIASLPPRLAKLRQVRSKPRAAGHKHLEVYLRSMEKARLSTIGESYAKLLKGAVAGWERADQVMRESMDESPARVKKVARRTLSQGSGPKPWRLGTPR